MTSRARHARTNQPAGQRTSTVKCQLTCLLPNLDSTRGHGAAACLDAFLNGIDTQPAIVAQAICSPFTVDPWLNVAVNNYSSWIHGHQRFLVNLMLRIHCLDFVAQVSYMDGGPASQRAWASALGPVFANVSTPN